MSCGEISNERLQGLADTFERINSELQYAVAQMREMFVEATAEDSTAQAEQDMQAEGGMSLLSMSTPSEDTSTPYQETPQPDYNPFTESGPLPYAQADGTATETDTTPAKGWACASCNAHSDAETPPEVCPACRQPL